MNTYDVRYMQLQQEKLDNIINKQQTVVSVATDLFVTRQTIHKWLIRYKRFGLEVWLDKRERGINCPTTGHQRR